MTTSFNLTITPRPKSHAFQESNLETEFATQTKDVVIWNDGSGVFTTRYKWHGVPSQVPIVTSEATKK